MWYRVKYRTAENKQKLWVVEADSEEEALMCSEIETGYTPESLEIMDEHKMISPLLVGLPKESAQ
jgi:hypothetical protein